MRLIFDWLAQELHAHLIIGIDALQCLAEFFEGNRSVTIAVLNTNMHPIKRMIPSTSQYTYQFSDGVIGNRGDLIVVNVTADHHLEHLEQFTAVNLHVMISVVHIEEEPQFALPRVELRGGRLDFAVAELGEQENELLEVDLVALAVVIHDDVDEAFAQRVDVDLPRANGEDERRSRHALTSGMHRRSSRVRKPQSRLSSVLNRL